MVTVSSSPSPPPPHHLDKGGGVAEYERTFLLGMDQITTKTPNSKSRIYWCIIEFIEWRYSQSCWNFRPLFWTSAPLTFSLVHLPHPFSVWISTGLCIYTVCNGGGGGDLRVVWRASELDSTLCPWPDSEPTKLLYHYKQKPWGGGGLRQINTCLQVPLQVNF